MLLWEPFLIWIEWVSFLIRNRIEPKKWFEFSSRRIPQQCPRKITVHLKRSIRNWQTKIGPNGDFPKKQLRSLDTEERNHRGHPPCGSMTKTGSTIVCVATQPSSSPKTNSTLNADGQRLGILWTKTIRVGYLRIRCHFRSVNFLHEACWKRGISRRQHFAVLWKMSAQPTDFWKRDHAMSFKKDRRQFQKILNKFLVDFFPEKICNAFCGNFLRRDTVFAKCYQNLTQ